MGWLSVAALVIAGCDKGASPSGLFTEDDLSALEAKARALPPYEMPNFATLGSFPDIDRLKSDEPTHAVIELGRLISADSAVSVVRRKSDTWVRLERIVAQLRVLLPRAQLTPAQLDELASNLEAALATEAPIANELLVQSNGSRQMLVAPPQLTAIHPLSSDELGLHLAAQDALDGLITQSCSDTLSACRRGLQASLLPLVDAKALIAEHGAEIQALRTKEQRRAMQSQLASRLARGELRLFDIVIDSRAMAIAEIAVLQTEVEFRRTGRCDPAPFMTPARLGEPLVGETHERSVEVWAPAWAFFATKPYPLKVGCP